MRLLRIAAAGAVLLALSACAGAQVQGAFEAGNSAVVKAAQQVNDDLFEVERETLCALPYSALARNAYKVPNMSAGITGLCGAIPSMTQAAPNGTSCGLVCPGGGSTIMLTPGVITPPLVGKSP